MARYYSLFTEGANAELSIYGDITSTPWSESDVSAHRLSEQLAALDGVTNIDVRINSYGGEVAEGLAIYNALRNHEAHIRTICDGMACSIASVIFMAGDERIMNDASLLMIHNAWTFADGNADELRKQADDLDTINDASKRAYLSRVVIDEAELSRLMDEETFLSPDDALEMGFATTVHEHTPEHASQSARMIIAERLLAKAGCTDEIVDKKFAKAFAIALAEAFQAEEDEEDEPETEDESEDIDDPEEVETDEDPEDDEPRQTAKAAFARFLTR